MQMLAGGPLLLAAGTIDGEWSHVHLSQVSMSSLLAFIYLVLVGSLAGFSLFSWLVRTASPTLANTFSYVGPVIAVFLGWLILSEALTGTMLIAMGVILGGVALLVSGPALGAQLRVHQRTERQTIPPEEIARR